MRASIKFKQLTIIPLLRSEDKPVFVHPRLLFHQQTLIIEGHNNLITNSIEGDTLTITG